MNLFRDGASSEVAQMGNAIATARSEKHGESPAPLIAFTVPGIPRPGGSKTATVIRRKGGAIVMKNGRPLVTTRESGKHTAEWRQTVAYFARKAYQGEPLRVPLMVGVVFTMPRPKNHYRANGELKPNAPAWHASKPDATKLMRAAEDALSGIVWADDSIIVRQHVSKAYGERPGMSITIQEAA